MDIVSTEAQAWTRAASATGLKLPEAVEAAAANLENVDAQIAALPRPVKPKTAAQFAAEGVPVEKATAEERKAAAEEARKAETLETAHNARDITRRALNRAVVEHRDELVHSLRPHVDAIIEEARLLAAELEAFHPDYDERALLRKATPKQLKAWQAAQELEGGFGHLIAAWRASFKAHAGTSGAFDIREVGREHRFFEHPEIVTDEYLNGTRRTRSGAQAQINPTVLSVAACDPSAGFRLGSVSDLETVYQAARQARVEESRWKPLGKRRQVREIS